MFRLMTSQFANVMFSSDLVIKLMKITFISIFICVLYFQDISSLNGDSIEDEIGKCGSFIFCFNEVDIWKNS